MEGKPLQSYLSQSRSADGKLVVALDLGGTWIKAGLACAHDQGPGLKTDRWANPCRDLKTGSAFADWLGQKVNELAEGRRIVAIAAATAGEVDAAGRSYLCASAHLGIMGREPWVNELAKRIEGTVSLVNDADAFLLGVAGAGRLPVDRRIGAVVVGTGLGFAVVHDGRFWKPARRLPLLGSARSGLQNYDQWVSAVDAVAGNVFDDPSGPACRQYLEALGAVVASAAILYHLDRIVIGGGITAVCERAGIELVSSLQETVSLHLPAKWKPIAIFAERGGNALVIDGALALARGNMKAEAGHHPGGMTNLTTEQAANEDGIETHPAGEVIRLLAKAESLAAANFLNESAKLEPIARKMAEQLDAGGRVIYVGAGTSGRIGALDSVEIPCTFGLGRDRFVALVAGGVAEAAFSVEMEGEEDISAVPDLLLLQVGARDIVIGISASGTAFYVRSALAFAHDAGAATVLLHESDNPSAETIADFAFRLRSGPELIRGSTRMKAGTATKKALNILSTTAMILLGKVRNGEMVDLQCGNEKLRRRAERIVAAEAGISLESAAALLANSDYDLSRTLKALQSKASDM